MSHQKVGCLIVLQLLALVNVVQPFGTGAPSETGANSEHNQCVTMTPQHTTPQSSTVPYKVTFSPANFTSAATQTLTVTLSGNAAGDTFKGFLLQARDAFDGSNTVLGSFTANPINTQAVQCSNIAKGAVTHTAALSSTAGTNTRSFTWTISSAKHIKFWYTVVKEFNTYWVQQESEIVYNPDIPIPTLPPMTTQASIPDFSTSECGKTKGCYRNTNCQAKDCTFFVSWKPQAGNELIDFEISGKTSGIGSTGVWVAVGFSSDTSMGGEYVNDCIYNGFTLATRAGESYNNGNPRSNVPLATASNSLTDTKGFFADGLVRCTFTRKLTVPGNNQVTDLNNNIYLIMARGPATRGSKSKHNVPTAASPQTLKVTDVSVNIMGTAGFPLVKAHGILMMISWLLTSSLGIIMARYFKPHWPNNKLCGEKVWFTIHRSLMISTFIMTCAAFVIIFVEVKGYSEITSPTYEAAHPVLGIIVTALCVLNPIMAVFRPHPGTDHRPIFNWAHFAVGFVAQILGITNVLIGVSMVKAEVPDWTKWVVVGFVCTFVIVILLLEIMKCSTKEANERPPQQFEMHKPNGGDTQIFDKPEPKGHALQLSIYMLYGFITIVFAVLIAVIIGLGTDGFSSDD